MTVAEARAVEGRERAIFYTRGVRERALAAAVLIGLSACGEPDPTRRVAEAIDEAAAAATAGDLQTLSELVSRDYADSAGREPGELIALVAPFVAGARGGGGRLWVRTRVQRLEQVAEGRVEGRVLVAAARTPWLDSDDPFAGLDGDLFAVEVVFVEERAGFRLLRADWERVRPGFGG